jgi:hypothetical protein
VLEKHLALDINRLNLSSHRLEGSV